MFFISEEQVNILTDGEFPKSIIGITEKLENCRFSGYFDTFDRKKLYYEYFLCEGAKANIVIVHGLSEFTKKYYELAYYFLNKGYNVFMYDQRCHGFSSRLTRDDDLIHVDSFKDYVLDLESFIDSVVEPASQLSLYIYSHSMGGTVTVMYLKKHPKKVKRVVLSAPLFGPQIGNIPDFLARYATLLKVIVCGKKSKFRSKESFNPEGAIKSFKGEGKERFLHNLKLRQDEPKYRSTPLTSGWIYNSLIIEPGIERQKTAESIKAPVLLITAKKDKVVKTKCHYDFASKCKSCKLLELENAGHSVFHCDYASIVKYITEILDFYEG